MRSKFAVDFENTIDESSLAWKLYLYIGAALTSQHHEMTKLYPKDEEGRSFFEEGLEHYRREFVLSTYIADPEDTLG